jgi:hypothetical protein
MKTLRYAELHPNIGSKRRKLVEEKVPTVGFHLVRRAEDNTVTGVDIKDYSKNGYCIEYTDIYHMIVFIEIGIQGAAEVELRTHILHLIKVLYTGECLLVTREQYSWPLEQVLLKS